MDSTSAVHVDLFERFAADRSLMDDPSLVLPMEEPKPVLSPAMMSKLAERAKKMAQRASSTSEIHNGRPSAEEENPRGTEGEQRADGSPAYDDRDANGDGQEGASPSPPRLSTRSDMSSDFADSADRCEREQRSAPWIDGKREPYHSNPWIGLHEEIIDFVRYVTPDEAEMAQRERVVEEVRDLCLSLWPTCSPRAFGSMATLLILPMSDIDICVTEVVGDIQEALTLIANEVVARKLCSSAFPRVIRSTRVPIVKFTHRETGLNVDISVNAEEGVANTEVVREFLRAHTPAFPLCIVVKAFLLRRKLNEPYLGGLGSYGTILLVISFLQHHPCGRNARLSRDINLGMLLIDFFRYYGTAFQWPFVGVSVTNGGRYFWKGHEEGRSLLVEDPVNAKNNVGASTRHFGPICRAFELAHQILLSDSNAVQHIGVHEILHHRRVSGVIPFNKGEEAHNAMRIRSRLGRITWFKEEDIAARMRVRKAHEVWLRSKPEQAVASSSLAQPPRKKVPQNASVGKRRGYGDDHLQDASHESLRPSTKSRVADTRGGKY